MIKRGEVVPNSAREGDILVKDASRRVVGDTSAPGDAAASPALDNVLAELFERGTTGWWSI